MHPKIIHLLPSKTIDIGMRNIKFFFKNKPLYYIIIRYKLDTNYKKTEGKITNLMKNL